MSTATVSRPKKAKAAPAKAGATKAGFGGIALPPPRSVDQLRAAIAKLDEKMAFESRYGPAFEKRSAELAALRAELDVAEVRETPGPAAVETAFVERSVPIAAIVVTGNHREHQDPAALERLAASLRTQTLQQRIGLRAIDGKPRPDSLGYEGATKFELIFGSRRLAAATLAGWTEIPAKVYDRGLTPAQVEILRSIENFGRKNLTAVEEAVAVARVIEAIETTLATVRVFAERFAHASVVATADDLVAWSKSPDGGNKISGAAGHGSVDDGGEILKAIDSVGIKRDSVALGARLVLEIAAAGGLDAYVGQQFSRSAKWVKDHAYVSRLGGRARALLTAGRIDIGHARELAKLGDKDRIDHIADYAARSERMLGGRDVEWVKRQVHDELKSLRVVPWVLDIAFGQGVPGCTGQACVTCPFNSKTDPDLFGGSITDEPEAGTCTNGACYAAKGKIVDTELTKAAKKATPVVKKIVDRQVRDGTAGGGGGDAAPNPITQVTVGGLLPRIVKPASGLRRLQKDLASLVHKEPTSRETNAGGGAAANGKPAKQAPEEIAKDKLYAAQGKWREAVREAFFVEVGKDTEGRRAIAAVLLDQTDFANELAVSRWKREAGLAAKLIDQNAGLIEAAIDCDGPLLKRLAVEVSKRITDAMTSLEDDECVPVLAHIASAWGGTVPPEPRLADFLPEPTEAKAREWVERMKACGTAAEARVLFSALDDAINALQRRLGLTPTVGEVSPANHTSFGVVNKVQWKFAISVARKKDAIAGDELADLVEQGTEIHGKPWEALLAAKEQKLSRPGGPPRGSVELPCGCVIGGKHAKGCKSKSSKKSAPAEARGLMHGQTADLEGLKRPDGDAVGCVTGDPIDPSPNADLNAGEEKKAAGGGDNFAEDEPPPLTPRDLGLTADELEKIDAVPAIVGCRTFATVKSVAHAGQRYVVLGATPHRGHECWRLAPLAPGSTFDLGGPEATGAAGRSEFHDIGVIDAADKKARRCIVINRPGVEPGVLYVRTTNTPAAAGAGAA